ncbi:MAG: PQQ-like beta-propeller repeat protein [Sedimentisphaerales bacterium]|nr:PQQ-like beta-propeller repeat protein [Sedimentisphaerales bacterium]
MSDIILKVMKYKFSAIIPLLTTALAVVSLAVWLRPAPSDTFQLRVPGTDRPADQPIAQLPPPILTGTLITSDGVPSNLPGKWTQFRGANFDNISSETIPLAQQWPGDSGPPVLWKIDVGEGYASPVVLNGCAYLIDYDQQKKADAIRCLSLEDGREIWRFTYPVKIKRFHGMSRTVPAITENFLVSLGPKCQLTCLDPKTGKLLWMKDLVHEFKTTIPQWYAGQCPFIENDRVIIAPGGTALMIALDCPTGNIIWQSPNPNEWKMTHSSIVPMEFDSQKTYVYCGSGGVAGIAAQTGQILWQTTAWKISIATVPTPVIIPPDRIFISGGYNSGCMMIRLTKQNEKIITEEIFRLDPELFGSDQQTPILYQNHIIGVRPDGQMACMNLDGKIIWTSGPENTFGLGPYTIADNIIFAMNDSGRLTMIQADTQNFKLLDQAQILQGHDSWGPLTLTGGRLILRDLTQMFCLDVTKK